MNNTYVDQFEYRVLYNSDTRECTEKHASRPEDKEDSHYVLVTREEYEEIEFCLKFFVSQDQKIRRKKVDFTASTKLKLTDSESKFRSTKDNNIFFDSNGADNWEIRKYE